LGSPELRAGRWAALLAGALAACSGGGADPGAPAARSELRVARKPVEDVFLLSGGLVFGSYPRCAPPVSTR